MGLRSFAHLGAQAEAEAVGEARGHVVECAGAVDLAQELFCRFLVLCSITKHSEIWDLSFESKVTSMQKPAQLPLAAIWLCYP